jgi:hypothetical protein|tara:strand:+ start:145 stop:507 length:363 start_codon:yes stop_codon:yes gene_type:complete
MNTPIREQLSRHTIEKLNTLRTLKPHTIKVLGILFTNAIDTVEHVDVYQSREKTYGEEYADKIVEIRMMSKLQLVALSKDLEYVKGFKSDYFKKKGSLTKQDWLNMKLYVYVMNRLVWSN